MPEAERARAVLELAGIRAAVVSGAELSVDSDAPAEVTQALASADIWLSELTPVRRDLESVFLELTAADTLGHES